MGKGSEENHDIPGSGDVAEPPKDGYPTRSLPDSSVEIGTQIGRYKLLSVLGEGGFGIAYLAEQKEPIRRQVALKIIKPGMDSKQVIARFEAEQQALALLDHPNIAHVFDAGTTQNGHPYFVMEYVRGIPITEHCDKNKLTIEERLKLFQSVCQAVQHAHQKGIIHRDIKPSNILVLVQGQNAVPKVIDFGVAKALGRPLTDRTFFTEQGQLIGTPEYMSPEQAEMAERDIDTRTDVYSLGVVLYELLTGALPFDSDTLRSAAIGEIQRIIREEEPPKPSTRLSSLGEEATEIAQSRRTDIAALARRLHKELEWIPMMAMRKERDRRYRSAADLGQDIENYVNGDPLIAGPETARYRLKKVIKRHRGFVAGVAAVLIVLVAGVVVSTIFAFGQARAHAEAVRARTRETKQRLSAEAARDQAEQEREETQRSLYFNRIALAEIEYEQSNIAKVKELLQLCPSDLRAWEWHRLQYVSDQSEKTLRGHDDIIHSAVFSPDGRRIVSGGGDRVVKVWDVGTGSEIITLRGHEAAVCAVTVSPDGKTIASAGFDGKIKLWDMESGAELLTLTGHKGVIRALDFSPNGKTLASCGYDRTIRLWNIESGEQTSKLTGHSQIVTWIDFSPDGNRLVSCSHDYTIKLWDVEKGKLLREVPLSHADLWRRGPPNRVEFSSDNQHIMAVLNDGIIWIWDAETLQQEWFIRRIHKGGSITASYSPDGKRIVSGGQFGDLNIWDGTNGELKQTLRGHQKNVTSVAFSPDGKRIVSASADCTLKLWNAAEARGELLIGTGHHSLTSITFSNDGLFLSSGGPDSDVQVWASNAWDQLINFRGHTGPITSVAFSPDGKYVASGSYDSSIRIWDHVFQRPFPILILKGHSGAVYSAQYTPDGNCIISGGADGTIRIWNANTGSEIARMEAHENGVRSVAVSSDGRRIASGGADEAVKIWDYSTRKSLMTLCGHNRSVRCVAFNKNGNRIVSGDDGGAILVWGSQGEDYELKLEGHRDVVTGVAFSPDGKRIFSSSLDQSVQVWDAERGNIVTRLGSEVMTTVCGPANSIAVSPDGNSVVASCQYAGMMAIWNSDSSKEKMDTRTLYEFYRKYRTVDGAMAACEMTNWTDWFYIGALAEAYYQATDRHAAVKWQKDAIRLLSQDVFPDWQPEYEFRLKLYEVDVNELKENPGQSSLEVKQFQGHHYLLCLLRTDWKEAKTCCESLGGHLATITTKEEHEWIKNMFPPSSRYWLGGTDEEKEGEWKWVTGEKWGYSLWNKGEPNNQRGLEHYLNMWENGCWNDDDLAQQLWFLIEWEY